MSSRMALGLAGNDKSIGRAIQVVIMFGEIGYGYAGLRGICVRRVCKVD